MTTAGETARRPHGRMINCTGGYCAYVPEHLLLPLTWTSELALDLSDTPAGQGDT